MFCTVLSGIVVCCCLIPQTIQSGDALIKHQTVENECNSHLRAVIYTIFVPLCQTY